jgi:hypothetical protein
MNWTDLLNGVSTTAQNIAGVYSTVQNVKTNAYSAKAQAEIDKANISASRDIAVANANRATSLGVTSQNAAPPVQVISGSSGGMNYLPIVAGLALVLGLAFAFGGAKKAAA